VREELCAWGKLRDGAGEVTAGTLCAYAAGKLAYYKIPRQVLVVDEFPMTVTGR
jgi:fatty-acyl-CoA synthase